MPDGMILKENKSLLTNVVIKMLDRNQSTVNLVHGVSSQSVSNRGQI